MSELHILYPQAAPARESAIGLRSEEPLLPSPSGRACSPSSLLAREAFELGFRHAVLRWRTVMMVLALLVVLPLSGVWFLSPLAHSLSLMVPILACLMALDGEGRAERFWMGIGGPPAMRELGRMVVELGLLQMALAGSNLAATKEVHSSAIAWSWGISLVIYSLFGLTRSIASGVQGRMLVAVGLSLSIFGTAVWPHLALGTCSEPELLAVVVVGAIPLGLVTRLLLTGRWSAAGAERRWWSPAWLFGPVLGLLPFLYPVLERPLAALATLVGLGGS